jgi:hypothetical protein
MTDLTLSTPFVAPASTSTPPARPAGPAGPRPPDLASAPPAPESMPVAIEAWPDPVIDRLGHDPRSAYVERFWLSILGPSTVVLLRRLAAELDEHPGGVTLDLLDVSHSIGVGMKGGRQSAFMRTIDRARRFGGLRWQTPDQLAVRRKLPPLTRGQLTRLSPALQHQHDEWVGAQGHPHSRDDVNRMRERARGLALSLLELGEDPSTAEQQLHRWRFHPAVAHEAMRWAVDRRRTTASDATSSTIRRWRPSPGPAPAEPPSTDRPPLDAA